MVYRVQSDYERFAFLTAASREDEGRWHPGFKGEPVGDRWDPPALRLHVQNRRKNRVGDFLAFESDRIVAGPRALAALGREFEAAGETLPFEFEGERHAVVNVLRRAETIQSQSFDFEGLFKTPQDRFSRIYLVERETPGLFLRAYAAAGLSGLLFEEVWRDGAA